LKGIVVNFGVSFYRSQCFDRSTACLRAALMVRPIAGTTALRWTMQGAGSGNGNEAWSHSGEGIT
jgi:hypothetical protein